MMETLPPKRLATYARLPVELNETDTGSEPTATVPITDLVAVLITATWLAPLIAT